MLLIMVWIKRIWVKCLEIKVLGFTRMYKTAECGVCRVGAPSCGINLTTFFIFDDLFCNTRG